MGMTSAGVSKMRTCREKADRNDGLIPYGFSLQWGESSLWELILAVGFFLAAGFSLAIPPFVQTVSLQA